MHRRPLQANYIFTCEIYFLVNRHATVFGLSQQGFKIDYSIVLILKCKIGQFAKTVKKALGWVGVVVL